MKAEEAVPLHYRTAKLCSTLRTFPCLSVCPCTQAFASFGLYGAHLGLGRGETAPERLGHFGGRSPGYAPRVCLLPAFNPWGFNN